MQHLLDLHEIGDEIMAEKGLTYCARLACTIKSKVEHSSIFKFSNSSFRVIMFYVQKKIARLRIHVEMAVSHIKESRIFQPTILVSMWDAINELVYVCVCAMLHNFSPPLVY